MDVEVVVIDLEGTVCSLDFVRVELMGWVRSRLPAWIEQHCNSEAVENAKHGWKLESANEVTKHALHLMDGDVKDGLLKQIQAQVMKEGWERELSAPLFPEVVDALQRWHKRGVKICIYSSGAESAQRALVAHIRGVGDLSHLFSGFFDTSVGSKQERSSYEKIATLAPKHVHPPLFCTDMPGEAQAAKEAGWRVALLRRPGNFELPPNPPAPVFDNLDEVGKHFGLDK